MAKGKGGKKAPPAQQSKSSNRLVTVLVVFAVLVAIRAATSDSSWPSWSDNPLADSRHHFADPGVLHAADEYIAYGTSAPSCPEDGCPMYWVPRYTSPSLKRPAELADDAMPDMPAWVHPDDRDIWAPSVARIGDQYVMYFAATAGPGGGLPTGAKCLGLATSRSVAGPFRPSPHALWCVGGGFWALDPYPVSDGDRWFLLWREDDADNVRGRIVGSEMTADGMGFTGANKPTLMAGEAPWEDGGGVGGRTGAGGIGPIENPAIARHPETGQWLLTWSANRWETRDYATGLATCMGPLGPCARVSRDEPWLRTSDDPSIDTGASFSGAGGLTFVPDGDRLYVVFHAYRDDLDGEGNQGARVAWAYRVVVDDNAYRLTEF